MILAVTALPGEVAGQLEALPLGPYGVGFESRIVLDVSRDGDAGAYDPERTVTGGIGRPIQIAVWYPTPGHDGPRMPFWRYLLLQDRSRGFDGWSDAEAEAFLHERVGDGGASLEAFYQQPTGVQRDAAPLDRPSPLVVFSPSMLASSVTNTLLGEYLASHGYVVVSHPSMGVSDRFMDTGAVGADTQARDIEFLIGLLSADPRVDASAIGVVGHSWGGLAALVAAARNSRIGAVVSIDGSEEEWRDVLEGMPHFRASGGVTVPYFRLTKRTPYFSDLSQYGFFDATEGADRVRETLCNPAFQHFDFVSQNLYAHARREPGTPWEHQAAFEHGLDRVRQFLDRSLSATGGPLGGFESAVTDLSVTEVRHGSQPGEAETVAAILRGDDLDQTLGALPLEAALRRLEIPLWSGRYPDQLLAGLDWVIERHPDSARAHELRGVTHWIAGDRDAAYAAMSRAGELAPHNRRIQGYLVTLAPPP